MIAPTFSTRGLDAQVRRRRRYVVDVSSGRTVAAVLIMAWVVTLVFSFARPPFGSSMVYAAKFALALVVLGWAIANGPQEVAKLRRSAGLSPATLIFCSWLLLGTAGLFGAPHPLSGLALLGTYAVFYMLTTSAMPSYLRGLRDVQSERWLAWLFLAATIAAVAILMIAAHGHPFEYSGPANRIRYEAFFRFPNFLGYFSFLVVALSARLWSLTSNRWYLLLTLPAAFLAYEANSRTAMLMILLFPVSLFVMSGYVGRLPVWRISLWMGWLLVICLILATFAGLIHMPSGSEVNLALSGRLDNWGRILGSATAANFWLGLGLGREGFGSIASDSYFVSTFAQTGFLGTACLLGLLLAVLWPIRPHLEGKTGREAVAEAFPFCLLITLILYSLFENVLFSLGNALSLYVWIEVGVRLRSREALSTSSAHGTTNTLAAGHRNWRT